MHILIFNNPQIQFFQFSKDFSITPLIFIHWKHSENHPKILQKLLNQGLQTNWAFFKLNEN